MGASDTSPLALVRLDLNADVGEAFGAWSMGGDERLLTFVTSCNVACGFHAGDPRVIDRTVATAVRAGVVVGAHPSHFDLRGFGRREIPANAEEVETDVLYQVGALAAFVRSHGSALRHVKPHGALYNQAAVDPAVARAVARGTARVSEELILVGLASSSAMRKAAAEAGLRFAAEAFTDRAYLSDGTLASRRLEGAVILDPQKAAEQALRIARDKQVCCFDGGVVSIEADSLCLHGDNPNAEEIAWAVRQALEEAGVTLAALA